MAFLKNGWLAKGWLVTFFWFVEETYSNDYILLFFIVDEEVAVDFIDLADFVNFFNKGLDCYCSSV